MGAELEGLGSLNDAIDDISDRWAGDSVAWIVGTDKEYGPYLEFGTAPHTIEGDPLVFTIDGETVFVDRVEHPGTDPQPFMRPALRAAERDLQRIANASGSLEEFVSGVAFRVEAEARKRAPRDTGELARSIEAQKVE